MTTAEVLEAIRDAIAADSTLDAWCQAEIGKSPTVHLGIDEANPPPESDYPIVVIVGSDHLRSETEKEIAWPVYLGVGVVNGTVLTDGRKKTYEGLLQAEAMREQVENALYRSRIAGLDSAGNSSQDSEYPIFVSFSVVTVREIKTTRRGLP